MAIWKLENSDLSRKSGSSKSRQKFIYWWRSIDWQRSVFAFIMKINCKKSLNSKKRPNCHKHIKQLSDARELTQGIWWLYLKERSSCHAISIENVLISKCNLSDRSSLEETALHSNEIQTSCSCETNDF